MPETLVQRSLDIIRPELMENAPTDEQIRPLPAVDLVFGGLYWNDNETAETTLNLIQKKLEMNPTGRIVHVLQNDYFDSTVCERMRTDIDSGRNTLTKSYARELYDLVNLLAPGQTEKYQVWDGKYWKNNAVRMILLVGLDKIKKTNPSRFSVVFEGQKASSNRKFYDYMNYQAKEDEFLRLVKERKPEDAVKPFFEASMLKARELLDTAKRFPDTVREILSDYADCEVITGTFEPMHAVFMEKDLQESGYQATGFSSSDRYRFTPLTSVASYFADLIEAYGEENVTLERIPGLHLRKMLAAEAIYKTLLYDNNFREEYGIKIRHKTQKFLALMDIILIEVFSTEADVCEFENNIKNIGFYNTIAPLILKYSKFLSA